MLASCHVDVSVHVLLGVRFDRIYQFIFLVDFHLEKCEDLPACLKPDPEAKVIKDDFSDIMEVDVDTESGPILRQELESLCLMIIGY